MPAFTTARAIPCRAEAKITSGARAKSKRVALRNLENCILGWGTIRSHRTSQEAKSFTAFFKGYAAPFDSHEPSIAYFVRPEPTGRLGACPPTL